MSRLDLAASFRVPASSVDIVCDARSLPPYVNRKTVRRLAEEHAASLRSEAPRARQRTLSADELEAAIRAHLRAARVARKRYPGRAVSTTVHGGFVPNSYRYAAESDEALIRGHRAADLVVTSERSWAPKRPHGEGNWLVHRAIEPGQSSGTILKVP
jgi:hypothetical protein